VGLIFQSNEWSMQMALVDLDVIDTVVYDDYEKTGNLDGVTRALIGGITATKEDVWRVGSVSATKGYGPLLYRLAMQFATQRGSALSSHQSGITSDSATAVWKRFQSESDVIKVKANGPGIQGIAYKMNGNDYESLSRRYDELQFPYDNDIKLHIFDEVRARA
jgi:hypothetical protein